MYEYEWDETKRRKNLAKHGVDFSAIESFDWETASIAMDRREEYSEDRYTALGLIDDRLHWVCFTLRADNYRIISLRKANKRELEKWQKKAR